MGGATEDAAGALRPMPGDPLRRVSLDPRSREVLSSVVSAYIRSASPVSSRQLTRGGAFNLSPASLRNSMADLEDLGFLTHPHVSAGRVPTDLGYRTFVEELMEAQGPSEDERRQISEGLDGESVELDRFLHATSRLLSRLTGEVAVVATPGSFRFVLQSVHFSRVAERKTLVVQVSEAGLVDSRLIETREDYGTAELESISRRLTVDYAGRSLSEARKLLLAALEEEKVRFDEELRRALDLGRKAFSEGGNVDEEVVVEGTETILDKPEFRKDVDALRRMFHAFDEKARLVNLLTDCLPGKGTTVMIGSENPFTGETQTSVVATTYGSGGRVLGTLGVIGPRRMHYSRVLPMVEALGRYVSLRLAEETT
jgi:heat-inducible transcriptional repressor